MSATRVAARYNATPPTVGDGQITELQVTSAGALIVSGATGGIAEVADDAADTGGSIAVGGEAQTNLSGATLVTAGDRLKLQMERDGALHIREVPLADIVSGNASNTDGTSTSVIVSSGAGIKTYLTKVILTNMHASSTIYVEMKSGTTVRATIPCPPGGAVVDFDPPLPPNAADEAWNFDPSAATTTIYCTAVGFKSKI